jgi:hypothetical protein
MYSVSSPRKLSARLQTVRKQFLYVLILKKEALIFLETSVTVYKYKGAVSQKTQIFKTGERHRANIALAKALIFIWTITRRT